MIEGKLCYVIMPFDDRHKSTYTDAIRPAVSMAADVSGVQLECLRADEIRTPGSITKEIVTSLYTADLVIADLSGNNPNVFYELGVVHSAGTRTIMIAESADALPFDISSYRIIEYSSSPDGLEMLRQKLAPAIVEVLLGSAEMTNPVDDFAPVHHSELIVSLDKIRTMEDKVAKSVWLIEPSLDTDLQLLQGTVKRNLLDRGVAYRYLLPHTDEAAIGWKVLLNKLGLELGQLKTLEARYVQPHYIESEVVIYDAYTSTQDVLIMSAIEDQMVTWYRLGKSRAKQVRNRFVMLWEKESTPLDGSE